MLLALDTATTTAALAVYDLKRDRLLAEMLWQARRRQTQDLLTAAQRLLAQVEQTPQAIRALAVTTGPGSFTGVRIAISTVKGIGLGLATAPAVVGIPTLCVTAAPWLTSAEINGPAVEVWACIQAGRGRYNWVTFAPGQLLRRPAADEHGVGTARELVDALGRVPTQPRWLVGEIDADLQDAVAGLDHVYVIDEVSGLRRAGHLARLAARHLEAGAQDDLRSLQPLYLRQP